MSKLKTLLIIAAIIGGALAIKAYTLYQAISPNAIVSWQQSDEQSNAIIDHQLWGDILNNYLRENTNSGVREFDYTAVSQDDKAKLTAYLTQLQAIDPRDYNPREQIAYWANLYNALTIDLILKNYPLSSIKEIGDGFTGPWNEELAVVANTPLTLNKIEHGILRGIYQDERIHYVINCASIGCPDLPANPLTGLDIENQLEQGAKRFINQRKGVYFDSDTLVLSSIYSWFSIDFGDNERDLLLHLSHYAEPELQQKLRNFNGNIDFAYNWKLNQPN
ncbi:MAG: DUF547 domain-containing protein [Psychrobium sp.]